MEIKPIKPEHKEILDKIRELYIQSGGQPLYDPEDWGLNDSKKSIEGIEVSFDYGSPVEMFTPDGFYMILGSCVCADSKKFWELFTQEFDCKIVIPKRDDSKTPYLQYQLCNSGPLVRIG